MKQKFNLGLLGAIIMSRTQNNTDRDRDKVVTEKLRELLISKMEKGSIIDRDKVAILLNKAINEILDKC